MPSRRNPEKKAEITKLRENTKISYWLKRVAKEGTGSGRTEGVYIVDIYDFFKFAKMAPEEILATAGKKLLEDAKSGLQQESWAERLTTDFFNKECEKGARTSAKRKYGVVRSFFRAHGLLFTGKTPDATTQSAPLRVYDDELVKMWEAAPLEEKQVVTGLRSTGWRPSEFVDTKDREGKVRSGIVYGEIKKDLDRGEKRLYFERVSKKEQIWIGQFFSVEATHILRLALEKRRAQGEVFTDETRIFPYGEAQLAQYVKQAAHRVGLKITPKTFRKMFRTRCSSIIGKDAVCRMAGWTIPGVGKVYDLPPREETLKRYLQIERLVTFEQAAVSSDDARKEAILTFAKMVGYTDDKIEEMRGRFRKGGVTPDEVEEIEKQLKEEMDLIKHANASAGGLAFQQQARTALADLFLGAIEDVKKELREVKNKS